MPTPTTTALFLLGSYFVYETYSDYQTSGKMSKEMKGYETFVVTIGMLLFALIALTQRKVVILISPSLMVFVFSLSVLGITRGLQYFWYVGFLSGVRRQHVKKLRAKWENRLKWLERMEWVLEAREEVVKLVRPKALYEALCRQHFKKDPIMKKRVRVEKKYLEWKLRHITTTTP